MAPCPPVTVPPPTPGRRLRVLSLSTVFPSEDRPTHGLFVEERLARCAERADVTVLAPVPWQRSLAGPNRPTKRRGLRIHRPRFWYLPRFFKGLDGAALLRSVRGLAQRLHAGQPFDLIDAHFAWPEGAAALGLREALGIPVTVTLRGTLEWLAEDPARGPRMAEVVRTADRIVAVSHDLAERAHALGAPPERVRVIPNGVDIDRFRPRDRSEARRSLGLAPEGPLLVSVGHLSPRKGFQDLVSVLGTLRASHPGAALALVGGPGAEGDNRADLQELARANGVGDAVHFLGPRSPDGVARLSPSPRRTSSRSPPATRAAPTWCWRPSPAGAPWSPVPSVRSPTCSRTRAVPCMDDRRTGRPSSRPCARPSTATGRPRRFGPAWPTGRGIGRPTRCWRSGPPLRRMAPHSE